jgi:hypothetical protein
VVDGVSDRAWTGREDHGEDKESDEMAVVAG